MGTSGSEAYLNSSPKGAPNQWSVLFELVKKVFLTSTQTKPTSLGFRLKRLPRAERYFLRRTRRRIKLFPFPLRPRAQTLRGFFESLTSPHREMRACFLVWSFPRGIHPGGSERSAGCMCIRAVGAIQRFPAAAALPSGLPAPRRCGTGGRTFQNRHSALPAFSRIPVP